MEEGFAARAIAAYIDLNPVRAGMVEDPADYRWSGYGEAMGGETRARAGLIRALCANQGWHSDANKWPGQVSKDYQSLLVAAVEEKRRVEAGPDAPVAEKVVAHAVQRRMKAPGVKEEASDPATSHDAVLARVVAFRVRYFTDGVAIGSRDFVNGVFESCRDRFGPRRKDGARPMRGAGAAAKGLLWSARSLQRNI